MDKYYNAIETLKNSTNKSERIEAARTLEELIQQNIKLTRENFGLKTTIAHMEQKIVKWRYDLQWK